MKTKTATATPDYFRSIYKWLCYGHAATVKFKNDLFLACDPKACTLTLSRKTTIVDGVVEGAPSQADLYEVRGALQDALRAYYGTQTAVNTSEMLRKSRWYFYRLTWGVS